MKLTLYAKVSLAVTMIIVTISVVSTAIFVSAHSRSKEQGRLIRGTALTYALAKSAEEGLVKEDLNLIKKAAAIIQAPDVLMVQVFSTNWDPVDSFPFDRLHDSPSMEAIEHYQASTDSFSLAVPGGYDFYEPILFRTDGETTGITIGYVRVVLSSATILQEVRGIVATNVTVAALITFLAVVMINVLVSRLVIRPVMDLHRSMAAYREGGREVEFLPGSAARDEIGDLTREFRRLLTTVREREQQLTESDQRIRSLFERVEHAIFRTDAGGTIIEANARFHSLFGDAAGLCDILFGDRSASECLRRAAESEHGLHLEDRAIGRGGSELFVSLALYPRTDGTGLLSGFDGYLIDVTEKKRFEERLMRSQKLEAVGTLAGGMAHDFNNLLTAILGYSGIMLKTLRENDPLYKPATIINDAAKRGAEFGRKILNITRKEKLETRPVQVNEVVAGALELLHRSMPKDIDIEAHLATDLPVTSADPAQIQQVIINLAVNARDAMPDGGRLTIETSVVGSGDAGPSGDPHPYIRVAVSDTGEGIDTETQTRIFDPFFTTKDVGKGTGLGLYIVQSIVNKHGGYINLYSEPHRGTRFNVYLPVTRAESQPREALPEDLKGSGTVLVIDDEAYVRELCKDILAPLGYQVLMADSGPAGIALFREHRSAIALVILDMVMAKMGGTEVFHTLRTISPAVRVLLYSGYSNKNFAGIDELLQLGAVGFIQKPFSGIELGTAVKKAAAPPA